MHHRLGMARLPGDEVAALVDSHPNLVNPRPGGYASVQNFTPLCAEQYATLQRVP